MIGTSEEIPALVRQKQVEQIIIATPSATAGQMRKIVERCEEAGVDFKAVPGPREIINGTVTLSQLRGVIPEPPDRGPARARPGAHGRPAHRRRR